VDYEELLRKRVIEPVEVSEEETKDLLKISERDIKAAQNMISIDLDWAFTIAYNAILQTSLAYMNFLGFRPRGEGKHLNTFRFLQSALPKEYEPIVKRLRKLRQKRNRAVYHTAGIISEKEAKDTIAFASKFRQRIKKLIKF